MITVPDDVKILAFLPHMHVRAKACKYDLLLADGTRRTVLDIPRYDFNWQLDYRLAEPIAAATGSRIEFTGWYDNSANNPANPDPTKTVRWGPQTFDEMLLGYVEYYVDGSLGQPGRLGSARGADAGAQGAGLGGGGLVLLFKRLDSDQDGKLTPREFPNAERFGRLDRNGDGVVTLEEARAALLGSGEPEESAPPAK